MVQIFTEMERKFDQEQRLKFEELRPFLEEKARVFTSVDRAAAVSLAISMKRIADQFCGVPYNYEPGADNSKNQMGVVDGVMHAIEQGIIGATRR
jgi:hypothetical protein